MLLNIKDQDRKKYKNKDWIFQTYTNPLVEKVISWNPLKNQVVVDDDVN